MSDSQLTRLHEKYKKETARSALPGEKVFDEMVMSRVNDDMIYPFN